MRKMMIRALGGALGLSMLALGASAASATSYNITGVGIDPKVGSVTSSAVFTYNDGHYQTSASYGSLTMGRIELTGTINNTSTAVKFDTYCIDLLDPLGKGIFTSATSSSLTNMTTGQITALTAFLQNVNPLVDAGKYSTPTALTVAQLSAAAQIGVWDIVYDQSGTYGTTSGYVTDKFGSAAGGAATQANLWLDNINSGKWTANSNYSLAVLQAPSGNQSQVYIQSAAVPEPASWAMMIVGFGAVGGSLRARRRKVAFAV